MPEFFEFLPKWKHILTRLKCDRSILLYGPRHYGKRLMLERLAEVRSQTTGVRCIFLSSVGQPNTNRLDYRQAWDTTRKVLGSRFKVPVVDESSFLLAMTRALKSIGPAGRVVFFLEGAGRGNEENHWQMLSALKRLLPRSSELLPDSAPLAIVAIDDYSMYYFNRGKMPISVWSPIEEIHLETASEEDIALCIRGLAETAPDRSVTPIHSAKEVPDLAESVYRLSGGHLGLVRELLQHLEQANWNLPPDFAKDRAGHLFRGSPTIESISWVLNEDPVAFCQTALDFAQSKIPPSHSPRVQLLRQIGVLHRSESSLFKYKLCSGAVADIVEEIARQSESRTISVGTLVAPDGSRQFEPTAMVPQDEDLVILHLSDLHVSQKYYRFRLPIRGRATLNDGEPTAAEVLLADLKAMGLDRRIDALVLSGDFSWLGGMDEFHQARAVIENIMTCLELPSDRVLIIPGNHDITWDPASPTLASSHYGKPASRENYDAFFELVLKRKPPAEAELLLIPSRSGKTKLRILGLDSNRVESKDAAGLGYVAREAFLAAAELLEADPINGFEHVYTWLAVHHHVFPATAVRLEQAQNYEVSLMGNTSELQEYAAQWQVEVILHGHEHQPSVTVSRRWPTDHGDDFTPLTVIGAGSFSVNRELLGPLSRNHYYVLYRRRNDLVIRSRQTGESMMNFVPHNDVVFDPAQPFTFTSLGYRSRSGGMRLGQAAIQ